MPLSTTSIANSAAKPCVGARVVSFGDSTVNGGTDAAFGQLGDRDFTSWAAMLSGGKFLYVKNAGISGNSAAEALARFDTDVAPYAPSVVVIALGINDAVRGYTLSTYRTSMLQIIAKCRRIGAMPWLLTVAPNFNAGSIQTKIAQYNAWLRSYCASTGTPLVDTNALLTDTTTGSYLSAYDLDGTHQNVAGAKVMGQAIADVAAAVLPPWSPALPTHNTDNASLITNGLFLTGSPTGTGWSKTSDATTAIVAGTAGMKGNWQSIVPLTTGAPTLHQNSIASGFSVGDRLAFCGRAKFTVGAGTCSASVTVIANGIRNVTLAVPVVIAVVSSPMAMIRTSGSACHVAALELVAVGR